MNWVESLQGQVVGLDTNPLIYFTEVNPDYHQIVKPFFDAFDLGEFSIVTSIITLTEALVLPLIQGNNVVAQKYRDFLMTEGVDLVDVTWSIAERAAQLRAIYGR
jgi:predicted nucleic acid-binding protein